MVAGRRGARRSDPARALRTPPSAISDAELRALDNASRWTSEDSWKARTTPISPIGIMLIRANLPSKLSFRGRVPTGKESGRFAGLLSGRVGPQDGKSAGQRRTSTSGRPRRRTIGGSSGGRKSRSERSEDQG